MKKAIVTGGAYGIGLAIAKALAKTGFEVHSIDSKAAIETIDKITYHQLNINDKKNIKELLESIGSIDILVNNAALQIEKPFAENNEDEIKQVLMTNLLDTIIFTHQLLPFMNINSQIINIGSVHSQKPRLNKLTYDVSKAGLDMFTKSLALELAPNIRVNQLNVGATLTPMNANFKTNPEILEAAKNKVPLQHIFTPEEIADTVLALTSNNFKWMTGSIVIYDGGRSLK